jgi:hypothetical protein
MAGRLMGSRDGEKRDGCLFDRPQIVPGRRISIVAALEFFQHDPA